MKKLKHITISGEVGSGKSILGGKLKEFLNIEIISIGKIQREKAEEMNLSSLGFNKYLEKNSSFDKEVDNEVVRLGKELNPLIFDSRMAWFFVPDSFKIHLLANSTVAADRILRDKGRIQEDYSDFNDAKEQIVKRKSSENLRFRKLYGVDTNDLNNYDLVIDTTGVKPETILKTVLDQYDAWLLQTGIEKFWVSPYQLYPTENFTNRSVELSEKLVDLVKYNEKYFIVDGHHRVNRKLLDKIEMMPARLTDQKSISNVTTDKFLMDSVNRDGIFRWEDIHGFKFSEYPHWIN